MKLFTPTFLKLFSFLLLLFALFSFKQATAAVNVPSDWKFIPTDLQNTTATFRLLFVTSNRITAEATQIIYYNNIVQNAARKNPALVSFANEFKVLGSTSETNARDNTNTNPASHTANGGYPIYFIFGHRVADNYMDFYTDGWIFPITKIHVLGVIKLFTYYTETGGELRTDMEHQVWTGSKADGTKQESNYLGSAETFAGYNQENSELSASNYPNTTQYYRLYGLSPEIKIDKNLATYTINEINIINPDFVNKGENYIPNANINNIILPISLVGVTPSFDTNNLGRNVVTYTITDSAGSETKTPTGTIFVVSKNKLDIDKNGIVKANSDGLMIKKYILSGENNRQAFAKNLIGKGSLLETETEINAYFNFINASTTFDVNLNKKLDKNDSDLILRYLFGARGFGLTNGLTFSGTRTTSASITQYLNDLRNGN